MSVYKDKGKWYFRGKIKNDDGSWRDYKRLAKGAKYKDDAKELERLFLLDYCDIELSKSKMTFNQLVDEYLSNSINLKHSTIKTKRDDYRLLSTYIGNKKINLIKKSTIQAIINDLQEKNKSESYIAKLYYAISSAFNYALSKEYLATNPTKYVQRNRNVNSLDEDMLYYTPSQFKTFINNVDDIIFHALFSFLYFMGVRRGEALALRWIDINFEQNHVTINKTMSFSYRPPIATPPKTKNSRRTISMPNNLVPTMKSFKEYCSKQIGFDNRCFVFYFDRPLDPETIRRRLKNYIEIANHDKDGNYLPSDQLLPNIHLHSLRHSHASFLINNKGASFTDYDIAKRMGDTVDMLHKVYAHWFKESEQNILDVFDKW